MEKKLSVKKIAGEKEETRARQMGSQQRELHRVIRQLSRLQLQGKGRGDPWGAPQEITEQSHRSHWESVTWYRKVEKFALFSSEF